MLTFEIPNRNKLKNKAMEKAKTELKIGSKLYWADQSDILAGIVIRFTNKRDVVINFVSGNELGEKNYPIKLANKFICK